ncbi:type I methionyl aminopeptidase [bacterium]
MIIIKKETDINSMRKSGRILSKVMNSLVENTNEGVTTKYLDNIAYDLIQGYGAYPSFLGYNGFPGSICTSINDEVVHGIPSTERVLYSGDVLSVDIGVVFDGFHADMAVTVPIGEVSKKVKQLINTTKQALYDGINKCRIGNRVGDIGNAIENLVKRNGFSVVREYVGHGIGKSLHEEPQIPNFGLKNTGAKLVQGMALALEPMVNMGTWRTRVENDQWTVTTKDGMPSVHFEHTILVTDNEPEILTELD